MDVYAIGGYYRLIFFNFMPSATRVLRMLMIGGSSALMKSCCHLWVTKRTDDLQSVSGNVKCSVLLCTYQRQYGLLMSAACASITWSVFHVSSGCSNFTWCPINCQYPCELFEIAPLGRGVKNIGTRVLYRIHISNLFLMCECILTSFRLKVCLDSKFIIINKFTVKPESFTDVEACLQLLC
jgi:hypothetical protein